MTPKSRAGTAKAPTFDVRSYLGATGPGRKVVPFQPGETLFAQGDPAGDVLYLQKGAVELSVVSHKGKKAVVAMLAPGDFFGEGTLSGQSIRMATAMATAPRDVLRIE